MPTLHPSHILAFLIHLSAWLYRDTPSCHHHMLTTLQIYPTPLLKAIVHAQHLIRDTHMTVDLFNTLGVPSIILETLEQYATQADENPLERRQRLATHPLIVEITIRQLTQAIDTTDLNPSEQCMLEHERIFWLEHRQSLNEEELCHP